MTEPFFSSIAQLRVFVKLNASLPWESIQCYVSSAEEMYLKKYITQAVIDSLEPSAEFMAKARRALAPLAVYLAMDEMAVMVGDAGITVQNEKDRRSPASDRKIQAAKRSLLQRGYAAMGELLAFILSSNSVNLAGSRIEHDEGMLISSLHDFERWVSLDGDWVAYFELKPLMRSIQAQLETEVGDEVVTFISTEQAGATTESLSLKRQLRERMSAYIAYRTASLHTSQESSRLRSTDGRVEWTSFMRPLFESRPDAGNWYREMADHMMTKILELKVGVPAQSGSQPDATPMNYNDKKKRIFLA